MAEGRSRMAWGIASHVMAIVASASAGKVIHPRVFNPYLRRKARSQTVYDISILKRVFVDRQDLLEDKR